MNAQDAVIAYFREVDSKGPKPDGWIYSKLGILGPGIDQLVRKGVIDLSKPFADMGSGDGRIVDLTSTYGIDSYGIDDDEDACRNAEGHIRTLQERSVLTGTVPKILRGDYMEESTYAQAGMKFEDFGTFFNYKWNEGLIAEEIALKSPVGTVFIVYMFDSSRLYDVPGIELEETIELQFDRLDVLRKKSSAES